MRRPAHRPPYRVAVLTALLLAITTPTLTQSAPPLPTLTAEGWGAIKFGMTIARAERALGAPFFPSAPGVGETENCWITGSSGAPALTFMVSHGRIVRITADLAAVRSDKGVGIGSSMQDVIDAYGQSVVRQSRPYQDEDFWLRVFDARHQSELIFETTGGVVDGFRAGQRPAVAYWESCG